MVVGVFTLLRPIHTPWVPFIGYVAGTLTTLSFVPQVVKVARSKCADDLSLGMLIAFFVGVVLWLIYGAIIWSWPVILSNFVTMILVGAVLFLKLKYERGN